MKQVLLIIVLAVLGLTSSCEQDTTAPNVDLAPYVWDIPLGFPAIPDSEENPTTTAKVALGKRLFFDTRLSKDGQISCASCHQVQYAFADNLPVSPGVFGRLGFRNAPSLANVGYVSLLNKDGGVPKLDIQALVPIEDHNEMDMLMEEVALRLAEDGSYLEAFHKAYGRAPDAYSISRALAAYQRTLISGNSAYDQYTYQGRANVLTEQEKAGMALFFSERLSCGACHGGFNFTNDEFINNGLHLDYGDDPGRQRVTIVPTDEGKFRVPSLRNCEVTAPYMHDGSLATLSDVVEHYNNGGKGHPLQDARITPLHLTEVEKSALLAFLRTLTDPSFLEP